jgi:hypothetical protein
MHTELNFSSSIQSLKSKNLKLTVTDMGTRVCVDPGGNGAIRNVRGEAGPGRPGRGRDEQFTRQQRLLDVLKMLEDKADGLGATSRLHYAQSMYHCMH